MMIDEYVDTYDKLREELCGSPAYIPIVNILSLIGLAIITIIILLTQLICEYFGIKELWNKIKDKKLPFKK